MAKSKKKKQWFTVAYFTREGEPHPAHSHHNFTRIYRSTDVLLEDLSYAMNHEIAHRGAHAVVAWPGQISEWEALHSDIRPLYNVYQGGTVEKL